MKWTDLPKLPAVRFTWEKSAKRQQLIASWAIKEDGTMANLSSEYKPVGWTDNPPFPPGWAHDGSKWIAIMYEQADFEQVWWHHMLEIDKEKLIDGLVAEVGTMDKIVINLRNCVRCGNDHEALEFELLRGRLQLDYSHWAMCPVENQPVFIRQK
ncbi:unnamed protein product [marine sediment metagenome]|uniref:Uncharacterized protein n=1 Tax=marine sediment metagenome TaxID=412755 RepID=X0S051_9ZZZZ